MKRSPVADTKGSTRDLAAVAALFVTNGLAVGVFGGSLPGLRAHLSLQAGQIVGILVAAAICAVASMNISGRLADRIGARAPSLAGGAGMAAGTMAMGAAPNYGALVAGAAVFGLGNGAMDVSMNTLGVTVEQMRRRPVMSRLHASFSIGNFCGAVLVVLFGRLAAPDAAPRWSLWSAALVVCALLAVLARTTPQSRRSRTGSGGGPGVPGDSAETGVTVVGADGPEDRRVGLAGRTPMMVWLLAAMAVCFGLTEGTAVDWSSLHVADVAKVSPSAGAWGLACVSGFMVLIRLSGDLIVERLGRATVVQAGSVCAMLGYVVTASFAALPVILVGWSLVGLGVGLVAPQIYGLAGHLGGGRALGFVVSFGYAAFLVGPAIIGFVGAHAGLQHAMLVPVVTAMGLIVMSSRLPADPDL